jgi:hypothetical protein
MKIDDHKFPLDIFSLKEFGVEKWKNGKFLWPVVDNVSLSIVEKVNLDYIEIIRSTTDERLKNLLIAQNKIVLEISGIFQALLALDVLKKENITPIYNEDCMYYNNIINAQVIDGIYYRFNNKLIPQHQVRLKKSIKNFLKRILVKNKVDSKFFKNKIYSLDYSSNVFLDSYALLNDRLVKFHPFYDISNLIKKVHHTHIELDYVVDRVLNIVIKMGEDFSLKIPTFIIDSLKEIIIDAFRTTNYSLDYYYAALKGLKKREFYIPSLGYIHSRTFALAAKMAGHITIGSTHGNSIGLHDSILHALIDLSFVDKYLVITESVAENYKRLTKKYLQGINNPEIVPINSQFYKTLHIDHEKIKTCSEIKNIMVIEYPLTETRHNIYSFWPYQAELMIRLGKFFSSLELNSIMKRHPDRLKESEGLYDDYYSLQLTEPFEIVFKKADAFFFMNISSTTFGFALTTNKPIFIFSIWLNDVWEEMIPFLKKRCVIIPSWFDDNGILQYDSDYFKNALGLDYSLNIDFDIVKKYMIP